MYVNVFEVASQFENEIAFAYIQIQPNQVEVAPNKMTRYLMIIIKFYK